MDNYTWVVRQVGKQGAWQPYQLAGLPLPPAIDDKVTIQRWASSSCSLGDTHKAAFTLDFDAHANWLNLAVCLAEVRQFVATFCARWAIPPDTLQFAFSGGSGFHVTVPSTLLGDVASPHLTTAYKHWATNIKDALGLLTLDAPSRRAPEWWWARIQERVGWLPPAVQDREAFALALRRVGIYTRRRMIRRENSQHPGSGLYKIPLAFAELALDAPHIRALAAAPRARSATLAPPAHAGLAAHVRQVLADIATAEAAQPVSYEHVRDEREDPALRDVLPPREPNDAPLCVRRILARPVPEGSSNMPLINLLSYWRLAHISEADAVARASAWLLWDVVDTRKRAERSASARSIARAVYGRRYAFRHRFVAPLQLVTDAECARCPLRTPCGFRPKKGNP